MKNENGANVNKRVGGQVDANRGMTTLHLSCEKGNLQFVKYLIEKGADVAIEDDSDESGLKHILRTFGFDAVANFIHQLPKEIWINHLKNDSGYHLLWNACKNGKLLDSYPDLRHKTAPDGTTPHFMAFVRGHDYITEWLKYEKRFAVTYQETKFQSKSDSFMTRSTEKIPIFNDNVEGKITFSLPKFITFQMLDSYALGDLCPMRNVSINGENEILYLQKLDIPDDCIDGCSK